MPTAQDVLNVARKYIGYKEGKNNSNQFGAKFGMNNVSWCQQFIWAIETEAGMYFYKTASCTACYNHYKSQAVSKYSLRPGDIVYYDWDRSGDCDHVGIVESAGASQVTTIEGNTSSGNSGSQSNGDGVYRRYRSYSQIAKAIRPPYTGSSSQSTITNGNSYVKLGQQKANDFLKRYGNGKTISTDGIRGAETKKQAIRVLQLALNKDYKSGLVVDGEIGTKTKNALGNHYVTVGEKQWMVTAAEIMLYMMGKNPQGVEYPGIFGSGLKNAAGKSTISRDDFLSYTK